MASPTHIGNGGIAYSTGTVTPAYPTLTTDDILILQVVNDTQNVINEPADWTKVTQLNSGSNAAAAWFWKRATGSESGTLSVTQTGTGDIWACISSWRGCVASGTPYEQAQETSGNGVNTVTSSAITPVGTDTRIVCLICCEDNTYTGPLAGGNYASDFELPNTSSSDAELAAESFAMGSPTTEVARAGAIGNDYWITFTIALISTAAANQIDFADTLNLTSLTSGPILQKRVDASNILALTTLTSDPVLYKQANFSDTLDITTLTSDAVLSLGAIIDFADTLALTTLTSDAKLQLTKNFADSLGLTSLTSDAIILLVKNFSDTLPLTTLTSDPILFKLANFSDTLPLTTLTSDLKLQVNVDFANTLNITTLTSDPILSGLTVDFADTLALTTLTSDPVLFKLANFSNVLALTTLTSDPVLSGLTVDFANVLALTTLTSDTKLQLLKSFSDILNITTLTSDPVLSGLITDFSDTLTITTLTSDPELSGLTGMYRWTGSEWVTVNI